MSIFISLTFAGCASNNIAKDISEEYKALQLQNFENNYNEEKVNYYKHSEKILIGLSMHSLNSERWQKDKDAFIKKAKKEGASVRVKEANGDENAQISQVEELIAEGVNVLVVVPVNGEVASDIVAKAHEADIKVISYDRLIKNSDLDYYISFDNVKVGQLQAEAMLKVVSNGKIAYVGGSSKDNNALLYREGAMKVLKEKIDSKSITLLMDKYSTNWSQEEAYKNVKEMLLTHKDVVDGIICANDSVASGALLALKELGLDGKVPVTGQDADLIAIQRIVEGKQLMTVYKPVEAIAERAVEIAIQVASSNTAETNSTIDNGYKKVPSYLLDPVEVNKDNVMDTVIKDGWYTYEEVYKNTPKE